MYTLKTYAIGFALMSAAFARPAAEPARNQRDPRRIVVTECRKIIAEANYEAFSEALEKISDAPHSNDARCLSVALHYAARTGNDLFAEALLAKPNILVEFKQIGQTALHKASISGHCVIIQKLLDAKANIAALSSGECTALDFAALHNQPQAIRLLVARGATLQHSHLLSAAFSGSLEVARMLIDKYQWDVNTRGGKGMTPLHLAASNGKVKLVEMLLEKKADINAKTDSGDSVLWFTMQAWEDAYLPTQQVAECLLLNGAHYFTQDEQILLQQTKPITLAALEKTRQEIEHIRKLMYALPYRDNRNSLIPFLPHDLSIFVIEYALTPGVYREYEQKQQVRTIAKAHADQSDNDNPNNNDDEKDNE